jgi:monovalent cation:H+ antiporter, CPA1 family
VNAAEESADILDRDRITLGLIALAGHERDTILARVRDRTISSRMAEQVLSDADRLIEARAPAGAAATSAPRAAASPMGRDFAPPSCCTAGCGLSGPLGAADGGPVRAACCRNG